MDNVFENYKFFKILLHITIIILLSVTAKETSEVCDTLGSKNDNLETSCISSGVQKNEVINVKQKYLKDANEKWVPFLQKIEEAKLKYINATQNEQTNGQEKLSCAVFTDLITQDLSTFNKGITKNLIDKAQPRGTTYQIIGRNLYREHSCKFISRCKGVEHFLLKIAKNLPDTEFIINVSDWPQISSWLPEPLPVFSFSKTKEYLDITYPAWTFWEGGPAVGVYPKGLGRWDLMRKSIIKATANLNWDIKDDKAFFRGSRTSSERDSLIYLSRKSSNLVDAQYTKNQAWKSDADTLNAPAAKEVSLEDHCKYKYLFNYRGVAASFRFKHLFLCKSLVFHVGDEWTEFFYHALKPWYHYIPVDKNADEANLRSLIEFVRAHDGIAKEIAERGFSFIESQLKMKDIKCYWRELLTEYQKLLKYSVQLRENMMEIK